MAHGDRSSGSGRRPVGAGHSAQPSAGLGRLLQKALIVLVLTGSAGLLLILFLDTYSILSDPEDYRISQQFDEPDLSWNTPSVLRYVMLNAGMAVILSSIALLSLQFLRDRLKPAWVKVYWGVVIISVGVVVAGYIQWMSTGYGH